MKKIILIIIAFTVLFAAVCTKTPVPNDDQLHLRQVIFNSKYTNERSYFIVFVPQNAEPPVPVLYLLNGSGADPHAWLSGADLQKEADKHGMMIVSVSTGAEGKCFYADDPFRGENYRYESYFKEIVQIVDDNYETGKTKYYRGIGGMSMGAMGAFYLASRNPDMFISASGLSGGFNEDYLPEYDNLNQVHLLMDCGESDPLIGNVNLFHSALELRNIDHIYNIYPGTHNWTYWGAHYKEHTSFHSDIFNKYR